MPLSPINIQAYVFAVLALLWAAAAMFFVRTLPGWAWWTVLVCALFLLAWQFLFGDRPAALLLKRAGLCLFALILVVQVSSVIFVPQSASSYMNRFPARETLSGISLSIRDASGDPDSSAPLYFAHFEGGDLTQFYETANMFHLSQTKKTLSSTQGGTTQPGAILVTFSFTTQSSGNLVPIPESLSYTADVRDLEGLLPDSQYAMLLRVYSAPAVAAPETKTTATPELYTGSSPTEGTMIGNSLLL